MKLDLGSIMVKANAYKKVLENTNSYRLAWTSDIKPMLLSTLKEIFANTGIKVEIKEQDKIENLESIVVDLGKSSSGISESMEDSGVKRTMIKSNGALIYQQLFNGKVIVMIVSPYIEGYGEPKPPRTVEILRPDELKEPFVIRHVELLLKDLTEWEDYDDDQPQKSSIGFSPIGFNNDEAAIQQ
jgi:hypothetical protein